MPSRLFNYPETDANYVGQTLLAFGRLVDYAVTNTVFDLVYHLLQVHLPRHFVKILAWRLRIELLLGGVHVLRLVQLWLAAFLGQGVVCFLSLRFADAHIRCWLLIASVAGLLIHS